MWFHSCALWRKRRFIETVLVITILRTCCQCRSRRERIITFFVGSCLVSTVFSSRTVYTERAISQPQCVSHSSAESEIISLDADFIMDGIPALHLWDLRIDVMHSNSNQKQKDKQARWNLSRSKALKKLNPQFNTQVSQGYLELSNDDFVSSNVNSCHKGTMLYIFEVNEAVIKMIMKDRSPTLRHVSRTHRVALDWLFDRITLDPKIQIRYVESTHSLTCWRKGISPINGCDETRYSGSCHRHRCGGIKRIQYSFCRINFIQRKSDQEITDDVKSSTRWQYGWHWYVFPYVGIFMTSSMRAAIFLGEDYSAKSARHQKYRWEANCKEIVRCDTETDSRTKTGNLRSVRN